MTRKQSPQRKELHRTAENASKARTTALRAARRDKSQAYLRFGTAVGK